MILQNAGLATPQNKVIYEDNIFSLNKFRAESQDGSHIATIPAVAGPPVLSMKACDA
jgi:hypothetical protein